MTTYLITGGLGFLGQYIVKAIHAHDSAAELRVLVRTQRKTHLGIEMLDRIHWIQGDLLQPETYAKSLSGVDVVIHNAAMISFDKAEAEAVIHTNVQGTRNLAHAAQATGCRNFIFISSISSIGGVPSQLIDETMTADPQAKLRSDAYGYSKLICEEELRALSGGMRVVILNPSVILGPGSERVEMVNRAVRLLPVLPMLQYINSFVDVRDVARAVVLALTRGRSGERYIVSAWNLDMVEFTRATLRIIGKRAWIIPLAGRGVRALDALLDLLTALRLNPGIRRPSEMNVDKACSSEKIQHELGWKPACTFEESMTDSFGRRAI